MNSKPRQRTYAGKTGEHRARQRRDLLIEAGTGLLGRQGYAATTVKAICNEAGLTERYFYESFQNREDFLVAVYHQLVEELRTTLLQAASSAEPRTAEQIARTTLTAFYAGLRDRPEVARIIYVEIMGVSAEMNESYRACTQQFADLLLMLSRPLFADQKIPGHDEDLLATGLVGAVNSILVQWMLNDFDKPLETVVETTMDLFTALTRHLLNLENSA